MSIVKIHDVAREAEVSISSVSRILRGGDGHTYPEATRRRVQSAAQRLGYKVHSGASLLRSQHSSLIGLSVYFTEHPHFNRQLVEVHRELKARGYDPVLFNPAQLATVDAGRIFPCPQVLAGLISLGRDLEWDFPAHYVELRERMPVVALHAVSPEAAKHIDAVIQDYEATLAIALEHLQALGHRHIAYTGLDSPRSATDYLKYRAWKKMTARLKTARTIPLKIDLEKRPELDEAMSVHNMEAQTEAIVAQVKALQPALTAIICGSDEIALCLQSRLLRDDWKLPQQLSVMGIDGIVFGAYAHPPLSAVGTDYRRMAQLAVERLLELIALDKEDAKAQPRQQLVPPQMVMRASTAAPFDHLERRTMLEANKTTCAPVASTRKRATAH